MHKASLLGCFLSTTGRPLLLLQPRPFGYVAPALELLFDEREHLGLLEHHQAGADLFKMRAHALQRQRRVRCQPVDDRCGRARPYHDREPALGADAGSRRRP